MRLFRVLYRPEAIADLGEIYRFVAMRSQNRVIARDFVERIKAMQPDRQCSSWRDLWPTAISAAT